MESSKNGEAVINPRYGVLEDWPEPDPEDPLSLIDKVELSLAYKCTDDLSNERILDYIHHNRLNNAQRITFIENEIGGRTDEVEKVIEETCEKVDRLGEDISVNA